MRQTRMNGIRIWLLLSVSVMLLSAGCGSSYTPQVHTVVIKGLKFLPNTLTVHRGDTIKWINKDLVLHDVTNVNLLSETSGPMKTDAVWKMAVTEDLDYFCSLHVIMKGKVIVE